MTVVNFLYGGITCIHINRAVSYSVTQIQPKIFINPYWGLNKSRCLHLYNVIQSSATSCKDLTCIDPVFVVTNQIIWYQASSYVVQHMHLYKTGQII